VSREAISLAITGASGVPYALRLLESLVQAGRPVYLMVSPAARVVFATESELVLPEESEALAAFFTERFGAAPGQLRAFGAQEWMAPVASGSNAPGAMVVCPCSSGTLAAIANGASDNLIERAADVMIKERRRLILVPRETPFSAIHLSHMLELARLGVTILPAAPGFYHRPRSVADLVDFVVARILDHLEVPHRLAQRWGEPA
jgi:4-hydroxy-3-polyprenylbenzoate decarboxylase